MRRSTFRDGVVGLAALMAMAALALPQAFAQPTAGAQGRQDALLVTTQYQEQLRHVVADPEGYAGAIVQRWEDAAKDAGRWDDNYASDLYKALLKLPPDNLLAAYLAGSFEAMMQVLATGRSVPDPASVTTDLAEAPLPYALGDTTADLVFTPVSPCRIADTRYGGGVMAPNETRSFDMDGGNLAGQGGSATGCGIPYAVARAIVVTVTVTATSGFGWATAWSYGASKPVASCLNYTTGWTVANTTVVPVVPGAGGDFYVNLGNAGAHVILDVLGYFAAPVATALDCTTVQSSDVSVAVNTWTPIDVVCPAGRTATGGGWDTTEGTLGYPGVWVTSFPNGNGWRTYVDNQTSTARTIRTYVRCCRIPGR